MTAPKLHIHSILAHSVAAFVPLASVAWILGATRVSIGRFGPDLWVGLANFSLVIVVLTALPTIVTGVGERNRKYALWHRAHTMKLALSLMLMLVSAIEIAAFLGFGAPTNALSWRGLLVVVINNLLSFWLGALGFKITLGRQGFGKTSYVPDMFRDPPIDIVDRNAAELAEPPRTIDPSFAE